MDGKVVVFLRTSSAARLPLYRHLNSLGVTLVLVHPHTPLPDFDGVFAHWLKHETSDLEKVYVALLNFLGSRGLVPDAVVSFDEYAVYQAAAIAARMNLTPIPLPPAEILQNNLKDRLRLFCNERGIPSPKAALLPVEAVLPTPREMNHLARDADALSLAFGKVRPSLTKTISTTLEAAALTFPVVLKPSPGAGSLLTRLCSTLDDVVEHVWRMWTMLAIHPDTQHFAALTNSALAGLTREGGAAAVRILAEEFIEGQEVDMDCIVEHGVVRFCSISDNFAPSPPYFSEVGGLCPSPLVYRGQCHLRDLLNLYVRAHGERLHGVIHFEAKYDPARQKAYLIEVNCRPGSAETNTMIQTVYRGLNLGEAVVRCALQMPIQEQLADRFPELVASYQKQGGTQILWQKVTPPCLSEADANGHNPSSAVDTAMWSLLGGPDRGFFPPQRWAASVNIYPTRAGVLRKMPAPAEDSSLVAFSTSVKLGETVAPPPQRFDMLCWMVVQGATQEEAIGSIRRVTKTFEQELTLSF